MKTRAISSLLSLVFVTMLSLEYSSNTIVLENTSSETAELILKKRIADKFLDDSYLLYFTLIDSNLNTNTHPAFKESFYTFKSNNILFRPPINA